MTISVSYYYAQNNILLCTNQQKIMHKSAKLPKTSLSYL